MMTYGELANRLTLMTQEQLQQPAAIFIPGMRDNTARWMKVVEITDAENYGPVIFAESTDGVIPGKDS